MRKQILRNNESSKESFQHVQRVLRKLLFDILGIRDDYIEISPIIKKVGTCIVHQ